MDEREELAALRRLAELEAKQAKAQEVATPNPAEGMGGWERAAVGAGGATRRAYLGVRSLVPGLGLSDDERDELATFERHRGQLGAAGTAGAIGADVAMLASPGGRLTRGVQAAGRWANAARALPQALQAAGRWAGSRLAAPAIAGAVTGAAIAPEDRSGAAVGGAIGGAAGEVGARVLTRALGGITGATDAARRLIAQGVDVPVWKASDQPWLRRVAESAKALPLAGPAIRAAEGRAVRDWNRTLVRDATAPRPVLDEAGNVIRWERPPIDTVGQEGARELGERFDEAYDALYRGRGGIPIDDAYAAEMKAVTDRTGAYLPRIAGDVEGIARRTDDTLRAGAQTTRTASPILDETGRPFVNETMGHATVPNSNVKAALTELEGSITSAWRRGDDDLARALEDIRDAVQGARTRGLPPEVQAMQPEVNQAYTNYKILQRAGSSLGAARNEGVVTPAQVLNAIKARDRSPDKSAFFEGRARGQTAAQEAQQVLGNELPDVGPGTAEKLAPWLMYGGGLGLPAMGIDSGALLLLGTPQGQRALRGDYGAQAAIRRNAERIADWLRASGTAVGAQ